MPLNPFSSKSSKKNDAASDTASVLSASSSTKLLKSDKEAAGPAKPALTPAQKQQEKTKDRINPEALAAWMSSK